MSDRSTKTASLSKSCDEKLYSARYDCLNVGASIEKNVETLICENITAKANTNNTECTNIYDDYSTTTTKKVVLCCSIER